MKVSGSLGRLAEKANSSIPVCCDAGGTRCVLANKARHDGLEPVLAPGGEIPGSSLAPGAVRSGGGLMQDVDLAGSATPARCALTSIHHSS
jgi:hypothetical protein